MYTDYKNKKNDEFNRIDYKDFNYDSNLQPVSARF